MTRSEYLTGSTAVAGALFAAGTVFWYAGGPAFTLGGISVGLDALLLLPATVIAGADIARRGVNALRRRTLGIELLVTVAAVGAIALGEFFEASAVTFLFALGGLLENRAMRRTRDALRNLWESVPSHATVVGESGERVVAIASIRPGDVVLVHPGERIPVDGTIERGESFVDESTITGESVPAEKVAGNEVFTATVNQHGVLYIVAERVGADSVVARIIARVEEAQDSRTRSERVIDRFSRYYTPTILAGSALYFLITGNLHIALTLLVVACPGALVIAAPVAVISAIGRAARRGVLIRGGTELEASADITAFATDKTGTLTTGTLRVADVWAYEPASDRVALAAAARETVATVADGAGRADESAIGDVRAEEILRLAAIAEGGSEHPIGRAIRSHAEARLGPLPQGDSFGYRPGEGVTAEYDGRTIAVGKPALEGGDSGDDANDDDGGDSDVADLTGTLTASGLGQDGAKQPARRGLTTVEVRVDGEPVGAIGLSDTVRSDAADAIAALRRGGIERVALLTGDNPDSAAAVAHETGIDEVHAELLPEQKLEYIRALQAEGHRVAMLGDGINDTPSLAAADIGIAMGAAGSDLAVESADLALMSEHLSAIPDTLRLARRTLSVIRQNLGIAVATVLLLLGGVLAGEVHMGAGMLIHQGSILVVIANGLRLRRG